ncbi:PREDICTED: protein PMR5 [Tarenaya hassleriana]|uniref:protein PMR5 n=1 Tax=Tarenaya hassleriana TaxID=28532 RepID=UPI00053C474F|nr:PREDICTED: protein PMR5 [Tarenaya hassleriana]
MGLPRLLPLSSFAILFIFFMLHSKQSYPAIILSLKNRHGSSQYSSSRPAFQGNRSTCSLFMGTWVRDDSYPLYRPSDCPNVVEPEFDCQMYGRPDSDYLKYRWQPQNCNLPRFNGAEFLLKMKGKSIMFAGDSIGKNQWESLICMIVSSAPTTRTQMTRGLPLSTFRFLEYEMTMSFYKAPFLVDIDVVEGKRVLKLDEISGNANAWHSADLLIFNTGHWWSHRGSLQGWDMIQSGGLYYQDMDRFVAMEKALRTWAYWVDNNVDRSRTGVFFLSISPTHDNPSEWTAGTSTGGSKNCYGETEPITGATYPVNSYTQQLRSVTEEVLRDMHNPAFLLDITMLSSQRKDGHPSVYSGLISDSQRSKPYQSADCSHWCLPGLPDTWNQLFYTLLFF